ncbi:competence protein ComK [Corticicoccus populi]|uniref:Competence protein ComK n=1 Tax=Corticicoccus populi TaxID=1812821 RepID=A0ABW5WRD3_9STAP
MKKQHYLINEETMYLMSKDNMGLVESKIGELYGDGEICICSPNKIIATNCKHHSQSYSARKELTKLLTNTNSKLPIIIDLFGQHIFFCTHSDRIIDNNWFNIKHVVSYKTFDGNTRITFSNNEVIDIPISFNSFNNQYLNALKLHYRFSLQKEKAHQKEMSKIYHYSKLNNYNREKGSMIAESIDLLHMNYLEEINRKIEF